MIIQLAMPAPSTGSYLPSLDAVRGFAALYVATFHLWSWPRPNFDCLTSFLPWISQGGKAVPTFTILSGFLIYGSLKRSKSVVDFQKYAIRRILRIFPLYIATVFAWLLLVPRAPSASLVTQIPAEVLMFRSLGFPYFLNPAAWSLYVELLFYSILPMIVIVFRRSILLVSGVVILALTLCDVIGNPELQLWKYFFLGIMAYETNERCSLSTITQFGLLVIGTALLVSDLAGYPIDIMRNCDLGMKIPFLSFQA